MIDARRPRPNATPDLLSRTTAHRMPSFFSSALRFPSVAARHADLVRAFVRRDLAARYEGSLLGKLWPLLHPALLLAVYGLVFSKLLGVTLRSDAEAARPGAIGDGWVATLFMASGILPWICTVDALNRCTPVVVENNNLIKKVAFPSELLPTYTTLVSFFQMLIGLALLVPLYACVMLFASGDTPPSENVHWLKHLLWLPLPIVLQWFFVTGLGMLLAAVNVFVRDVGQVIPLATLVWMFFTPIFYKLEGLARKTEEEWVAAAIQWNPLYHLMALYRGCFPYEVDPEFPLRSAAIFAAIALGTFLVGHGCFHRWKGHFADEV